MIWLMGVFGFLGLMAAARTGSHPMLLRTLAIVWFVVFGLANAGLVLWRSRAKPGPKYDVFKP